MFRNNSKGNSVPTSSALEDSPIAQATLTREETGIFVRPAGTADTDAYALCRVPKSLIDELAIAAQWFWNRHKRCLGILLMLEPKKRVWSATIPTQRCSRDSSCWSPRQRDLPTELPTSILVGSFQSRVLSPGEDPADCPPPHDGLHLVMIVGSDPLCIVAFLRCEGKTRQVPASDILFDDCEELIESVRGRLTFA